MSWIPRTKLAPPDPGADILTRAHLLEQLYQDATSKRLTLISAQAGSGKTTLAAGLVQHFPKLPLAWVTLDEGDNEPQTLLLLLTTAVNGLRPNCTANTAALLNGPPEQIPDPRRLVGLLINEILDCDLPLFVMVLDDLHTIDNPDCLAALDYLLAHLPPTMHLLATARSDPQLALAGLRARGLLGEVRLAQLRFTAEETAEWLNGARALDLTDEELSQIQRQTEGWITALRLLALSLERRNRTDRQRFIGHLAPGQHFIFDYLVDEVLSRLPDKERRFLLETSILEEMSPALCRAVTGRADAGRRLAELTHQNLFIYRREHTEQVSYRYHALLRQTLQVELRRRYPDGVAALHQRAARALGVSPEAADHLLAARAWEEAADVLQTLVRRQMELSAMPARLLALIKRLPEEIIGRRPWLQAAQGVALLQRGRYEAGRPLLVAAADRLADGGDELSRAYLLFSLSNVTVGKEMVGYLDQIGAVIANHQEAVPARWQVEYQQAKVWQHLHASDWPAVEQHLEQAVAIARNAEQPGASYTLAANNFTHFYYSERARAALMQLKQFLTDRFPARDRLARLGVLNISLCQNWYAGHPTQAEALTGQAQRLSQEMGISSWADANGLLISLYTHWARDALDELDTVLGAMLARMARAEAWNAARNDVLCWLALVRWRRQRGEDIGQFVAEMDAYTVFERQRMNSALVRALVADAAGDLSKADGHLRQAIARQREAGYTMTVDAQLLLAVVYWRAGNYEFALRELEVGLAEWQRRDLPGVVVQTGRAVVPLLEAAGEQGIAPEFAERCLSAFGLDVQPRPVLIEATGQTLTPREAEVLGLIIRGKTNPQIAAELIISESTVKSHVTKILAKLGVSRRTEAAVLARELGLG
ncbi:MAG: LuxR C-terminal-related transcriptional regulator [Candidatus Promineifilaceae bacterium]|nr:LuxR C-terminal-related transcriptional regulator [Candidatus Promineifilaceae bacterium]